MHWPDYRQWPMRGRRMSKLKCQAPSLPIPFGRGRRASIGRACLPWRGATFPAAGCIALLDRVFRRGHTIFHYRL